jgi:hypothetical protein
MKRTGSEEKKSSESVIWINPMASRKPQKPQFAICVNNDDYPASLELHKVYRLLTDDQAEREGDLRVIDESGEDYLYPRKYFVLVELPQGKARTLKRAFAKKV